MKLSGRRVLFRSLFAVLAFAGSLQAQTLKQIATIDLPGPKGERFDYLTMDEEDHYLLSAHLGPGILYVIDRTTLRALRPSRVKAERLASIRLCRERCPVTLEGRGRQCKALARLWKEHLGN